MADRPPTVYKYESFNVQSLLNLKAQSLYFGSPRNFNDPYDCAITATVRDPSDDEVELVRKRYVKDMATPNAVKERFKSMPLDELKKVLISGAKQALADMQEKFLNTKGVTCFSECNDDLLMWGHYGGRYKGFCLEFATAKEPFTKLRQVHYADVIPQVDVADCMVNKNYDKLLNDLYCTKSSSWKYEKEWRAIHSEAGTLFGYEADVLKAIYFGPDIERQALEIICLIVQGQNPDAQFFQGKRGEKEFKVEFSSVTYTSYAEAKRKGLV
ncbi:MAG: DUF2971 domain-containing protein [Proteobacteria bacterium]|nr:DUF2971 domain-containing protein [Pseudomonadota bacterium]